MARMDIPDPQAGPTEDDEEAVLAARYGPPCEDGVFHGDEDEGAC